MTTCCPTCGQAIEAGETLDIHGRFVLRNGKAVRLSKREFEVVRCLIDAKGRVVSNGHILDYVYGLEGDGPDPKNIDIFIVRARRKLKPLGVFIANSWGEGYALGVEK
jgi:DNA-binding response OmpR family regulator